MFVIVLRCNCTTSEDVDKKAIHKGKKIVKADQAIIDYNLPSRYCINKKIKV